LFDHFIVDVSLIFHYSSSHNDNISFDFISCDFVLFISSHAILHKSSDHLTNKHFDLLHLLSFLCIASSCMALNRLSLITNRSPRGVTAAPDGEAISGRTASVKRRNSEGGRGRGGSRLSADRCGSSSDSLERHLSR
jgi:hypothetical protein